MYVQRRNKTIHFHCLQNHLIRRLYKTEVSELRLQLITSQSNTCLFVHQSACTAQFMYSIVQTTQLPQSSTVAKYMNNFHWEEYPLFHSLFPFCTYKLQSGMNS